MKLRQITSALLASFVFGGLVAVPAIADAQSNRQERQHIRRVVRRENQQQRVLRQKNDRLRAELRQRQARLEAAQRAKTLARRRANTLQNRVIRDSRPHTIVRYTKPRTVVRYVPTTIYREVPRTTFRYVPGPTPQWYPTTPPNEFGSIASLFGGSSLLNLLLGDQTLNFSGSQGALYPYTRYEADRRSTNRAYRLRAAYFDRPFFYRNGHRYDRIVVTQNGHRYYRFVRR